LAIERVRRFAIAGEPLTTDNPMLTPSPRMRRHKVCERFGEPLERLHERT